MAIHTSIFLTIITLGLCHGGDDKPLDQFNVIERLVKLELMQATCYERGVELDSKVKTLEVKNALLKKEVEQKDAALEKLIKDQKQKMDNMIAQTHSFHRRFANRQIGQSGVAFSTFLDHDMDNLGPSQVIVFNQVQLNEGNGYNNNTGAFTVPISGVYVFTFFIGERDPNQLYVKLVVNGVSKSDAVAETVSSSHDAQGGNVVVLKVNQGDTVMVAHNIWGSHIEGYPDIRLSTFSGFLLYPMESEAVIGK